MASTMANETIATAPIRTRGVGAVMSVPAGHQTVAGDRRRCRISLMRIQAAPRVCAIVLALALAIPAIGIAAQTPQSAVDELLAADRAFSAASAIHRRVIRKAEVLRDELKSCAVQTDSAVGGVAGVLLTLRRAHMYSRHRQLSHCDPDDRLCLARRSHRKEADALLAQGAR